MQAIHTKYRGATPHRGSRIIVRCGNTSTYVSWNFALDAPDNHANAARIVGSRVFGGFDDYDMHSGCLPDGSYVHVLAVKREC